MKRIEHKGVIQSIEDESIQVELITQSACSACHAKSACGVGDMKEKVIDVKNTGGDYSVGETINLYYEESLGFKALILAYVIPFIAILIVLVITLQITNNEAIAGLLSLAVLVPYYFILYIKKDSLKKTFSFRIEKVNINIS